MQIVVHAGGKSWFVDEAKLLNWLAANAAQSGTPRTVVREVIDDTDTGRVLLNECERNN
jgi:hypothetical protein